MTDAFQSGPKSEAGQEAKDTPPPQLDAARPDVSQIKDKVQELMHDAENGRIIKLGFKPSYDIKVGKDGMTKTVLEPCPERGKGAVSSPGARCGCGQEFIKVNDQPINYKNPLIHPDEGMIKVTYFTPPSQAVAYNLTMVVGGDGPRQIWKDVRLEFQPDGTATRNGIKIPVEYALSDLADPLRNANFGKKEQERASAEQSNFKLL
jgi:hypothetical protein